MKLRAAVADDLTAVGELLRKRELPTSDLDEVLMAGFYVAIEHESIIGCIGAQRFGKFALIRSFAVAESSERMGIGRLLLNAVEEALRAQGVDELWLLTTTAPGFFKMSAYRTVPRESAPALIRASAQFAVICSASAECMCKRFIN